MQKNPYSYLLKNLTEGNQIFYDLTVLEDERLQKLPFTIRVLLQSAIRNCDQFNITKKDVENILDWKNTSKKKIEIPFKPARVVLQDLTGVPLVVDLAAMRDAISDLGGDPKKINPLCPVDLVIDHSIQVDSSRSAQSLQKNQEMQFIRNKQRFAFLKWGSQAFDQFQIIPPGSGIVHQVNLEYLARVVMQKGQLLYLDSVVGTDSHTTMINGLGVLGWGVGGIEAQAVMLGQSTAMVIPQVVGFKLTGKMPANATATDLVLLCTSMLRKKNVVQKFVQFYGTGIQNLSLADRATVSNMAPQYGATCGYFPIDEKTLQYLQQTGRKNTEQIKRYLKAQQLFYCPQNTKVQFSHYLELNLDDLVPCISGPKRPHDYVPLNKVVQDWNHCITSQVGFKGYGIPEEKRKTVVQFNYQEKMYNLTHGDIVIAAITSCTNTSNPGVMLGAGLLAKKAYQLGLKIKPYIKTSLSPGSQCVSTYLQKTGLTDYLNKMGFYNAGYGCMTCIGNSGQLDKQVQQAIIKGDLCAAAVLSGNRNFQGRVHPQTRANYLASPPLVIAYALAGSIDFDFQTRALGVKDNKQIYLKDIWPSNNQIRQMQKQVIKPQMFIQNYQRIIKGTERWNALNAQKGILYNWQQGNLYINKPPFFKNAQKIPQKIKNISNAHLLAYFGDSITTDHISPAGAISIKSSAASFLKLNNVQPKDFNTYGSRRGNDQIMTRGTFANVRILNKLMKGKVGPFTIHYPDEQQMMIFQASQKYKQQNRDLIIIGGKEYGSGSSRDWAAKGPYLLGVRAVIAQSYQRIHRSNLVTFHNQVGMGILPLQFKPTQSGQTFQLKGNQEFSIDLQEGNLKPNQQVTVLVNDQKIMVVVCRLNTQVQVNYFKHGGILPFVMRKLLK